MPKTTPRKGRHDSGKPAAPALVERLCTFTLERHPFALPALRSVVGAARRGATIPELRAAVRRSLPDALRIELPKMRLEPTPGVSAAERLGQAVAEVGAAVDGFLARAEIAASLTADERREMLRGMVLTRATDNQLKSLYLGSGVQYHGVPFQGRGSARSARRRSTARCWR